MPRLIDADALENDLFKRYCEDCDNRKGFKNGVWKMLYEVGDAPCRACCIDDMTDTLDYAPTVDAEPVRHGHWVKSEDADDGYCSVCKCDMPMYREDWEWKYSETPYCPNCGAKMDESSQL